jgi:hypoxia up-regulated 1
MSDDNVQVESLAFDIDFQTKVTRASLEEKCGDLKEKWAAPISQALLNAGLNLVGIYNVLHWFVLMIPQQENITSVIFTGGATRIPMVQNAVKAAIGE